MRYQQKQQLERDQKRSEFAGGRSLAAIDVNDNKLTATLGAGKVISFLQYYSVEIVNFSN